MLFDLDARLVEVWVEDLSAPTVVDQTLIRQLSLGLPALRIELAELFKGIWGDEPAP